MHLSIKTHLRYATTQPCDLLLQIEALSDAAQVCHKAEFLLDDASTARVLNEETDIGTRRWIKAGAVFECSYSAEVEVTRDSANIQSLDETPRVEIPGAVIPYMMPSRYCHSDQFLNFVADQFGNLTGGALVSAMSNWVSSNFTYDINASHAGTTATDSFFSLAGVCRDYAHMLISLARAGGIPARFVSAYAPGVDPPDFHAVVEVFLEGAWYIVDPTEMSSAQDTVRICAGRDAADASFMTSYGWVDLQEQSVEVIQVHP
ncbi:MAG: transglutaminase family protein [Roseobacter sp.]